MNRNRYGEMVYFSKCTSDRDRQTIESHMAIKWAWHLHAPMDHREATQWMVNLEGEPKTNDLSVNIGGIGDTKEASHSTSLSTTTSGITSYPPTTGAPEKSIRWFWRYPPSPHPVRLLPLLQVHGCIRHE